MCRHLVVFFGRIASFISKKKTNPASFWPTRVNNDNLSLGVLENEMEMCSTTRTPTTTHNKFESEKLSWTIVSGELTVIYTQMIIWNVLKRIPYSLKSQWSVFNIMVYFMALLCKTKKKKIDQTLLYLRNKLTRWMYFIQPLTWAAMSQTTIFLAGFFRWINRFEWK